MENKTYIKRCGNTRNSKTKKLEDYDETKNVAEEEDPFEKEPPVSVCVSCLLPGHQGGQECTFLKDECKYCGREHSTRLKCRVVEMALKYGGNAMNIVPEKKTWETPMENLCPDCLEIRHHSSLICKEKEPVLATLNVIPEEESPETVCVTCLITGHQGGKECQFPKDECMNCGHSHTFMLSCMEVRLALKHGGDPISHARPKITEDTPMEDICTTCHELRHHSCLPCKNKEKNGTVQRQETLNTPDHSPQLTVPMPMGKTMDQETPTPVVEKSVPKESPNSENKEAVQSQETLSTPDDPPQSTVPIPMEKTVAEENPTPVIEMSKPKESPKLSYRDALKKGSVQSQDTSKTPDYSPQLVTLMPKGKTLRTETLSPLCGRSSPKESPKGSWMKRVQNYIHGTRKKEPP